MSPEDLLFEAKIIRINHSDTPLTGIVEFNKVQAEVDLSFVSNTVEGMSVLVCGRTAIATVEELHEIRG
jgi:hydrogenase maturation factor